VNPSMCADREPAVWRGVAAGMAGGVAASWAMNLFQSQFSKLLPPMAQEGGDDATVKTAAAIARSVAHHTLTDREKKVAGPVVHYAFGAVMGAVYGGVAEVMPAATKGWGLPFGTALWIGADEIAVPAFGLAGTEGETPPSIHAYALLSHLVYGLTAEGVRRAVRGGLGGRTPLSSALPRYA
jgi:putative membrane protein